MARYGIAIGPPPNCITFVRSRWLTKSEKQRYSIGGTEETCWTGTCPACGKAFTAADPSVAQVDLVDEIELHNELDHRLERQAREAEAYRAKHPNPAPAEGPLKALPTRRQAVSMMARALLHISSEEGARDLECPTCAHWAGDEDAWRLILAHYQELAEEALHAYLMAVMAGAGGEPKFWPKGSIPREIARAEGFL